MPRPIVYTATWCKPCDALKTWITQHGYSVEYRDGENEKPVLPLGTTMMYPLLVAGNEFIGGVEPIQQWLVNNNG